MLFSQKHVATESPAFDTRFAELLATRLCHDVTGPIGAINNGTELLADDDEDMRDPALELIRESAQEAIARITFYRLAYGVSNPEGSMPMEQLQTIASQFLQQTQITLTWQVTGLSALPFPMARLVCNLLVVAMGTLIRGGEIIIQADNDSVAVTATGDKVSLGHEMLEVFQQGNLSADNLGPRTVQFYLTSMLASSHNFDLMCMGDESGCRLTAQRQ